MKKEYDFSTGKRGAIDPMPAGKTRITIRLDKDVIDWFRDQVESKGAGNYQTMINNVLREYIYEKRQGFEKVLRHVLREELSKFQTTITGDSLQTAAVSIDDPKKSSMKISENK